MPPDNASFIPKSGVKTVQRTRAGRRIYVLAYISYIVFFSTLFAVIGVYVYGATVSRSLSAVNAQLVSERQKFSVSDIESMKLFDKRLVTAKRLLDESSAPSRLFTDIEAIVASNIYFSGMKYELLPNKQFRLELTGRASAFTDIIGQRNLLSNSALLQEATVAEFDYSVGEGSGSSVLGTAVLSFVFADTRDLSSIAYAPATDFLSSVQTEFTNQINGMTEGTSSPVISPDNENVPIPPATPGLND